MSTQNRSKDNCRFAVSLLTQPNTYLSDINCCSGKIFELKKTEEVLDFVDL